MKNDKNKNRPDVDVDEDFVKEFLHTTPTESLLIPTGEIKKITESVNKNKTYCFATHIGKHGWCATCKVNQNTCSASNVI